MAETIATTVRIVSVEDIGVPRWMTPHAQHLFAIPTDLSVKERLMLLQLGMQCPSGWSGVDVGCRLGASTAFLALAAYRGDGTIHAVDAWDETFAEFRANVAPFKEFVRAHNGSPLDVAREGAIACDLLFVDAARAYEAAGSLLQAWSPSLRHGGTLALHDFDCEAVRSAFEDVLGERVTQAPQTIDRLMVCRVRAA
jgi:predicted O-methyltransferase YrrM